MDLQKVKAWLPVLCGIVATVGLFVPVVTVDYFIDEISLNAFNILYDSELREEFELPTYLIVLSAGQIILGAGGLLISLFNLSDKARQPDKLRWIAVILAGLVTLCYMIEGLVFSNHELCSTLAYLPFILSAVLTVAYYGVTKKS